MSFESKKKYFITGKGDQPNHLWFFLLPKHHLPPRAKILGDFFSGQRVFQDMAGWGTCEALGHMSFRASINLLPRPSFPILVPFLCSSFPKIHPGGLVVKVPGEYGTLVVSSLQIGGSRDIVRSLCLKKNSNWSVSSHTISTEVLGASNCQTYQGAYWRSLRGLWSWVVSSHCKHPGS